MNSKDFADMYLNVMPDDFILKTNYIILSDRISLMTQEFDNCITAIVLYPNTIVMMESGVENFIMAYEKQLQGIDEAKIIADILKLQFNKPDENFILLTSTSELKIYNFLKQFRDIVYEHYGYFIYDYMEWLYLDLDEVIPCKDPHKTKKAIAKSVNAWMDNVCYNAIELSNDDPELAEEYITSAVKGESKDTLIDYMKSKDLEVKDKYSKKDMIEQIVTVLM